MATLLKLGLWLYCRRLKDRSPAMLALAEDHWNDVLSNLAGIIGPTIAFYVPKVRAGRPLSPASSLLAGSRSGVTPTLPVKHMLLSSRAGCMYALSVSLVLGAAN